MNVNSRQRPPPVVAATRGAVRILVVVEGPNDVEFLRRISRLLHAEDAELPNVVSMEQWGELVFVPLGGGGMAAWSDRLAPLGLPVFHLLDREQPPETDIRRKIVQQINRRNQCRATLTRKRSLENYLHPEALRRAGNLNIEFGDFDPLPEYVARESFRRDQPTVAWDSLPRRAHKRLINRVKRWLNTKVVDQMTAELLFERDPKGEAVSWLESIARLASGAG